MHSRGLSARRADEHEVGAQRAAVPGQLLVQLGQDLFQPRHAGGVDCDLTLVLVEVDVGGGHFEGARYNV